MKVYRVRGESYPCPGDWREGGRKSEAELDRRAARIARLIARSIRHKSNREGE
jgi:hypothetical protein